MCGYGRNGVCCNSVPAIAFASMVFAAIVFDTIAFASIGLAAIVFSLVFATQNIAGYVFVT